MNPARITVRFPASGDLGDLGPLIDVFHRFIQRGLVEGLVLDVADYRHVPKGPGVLLVGHDVDYGVNEAGLTVLRKRTTDDLATQFRDALRMGLGLLQAVGDDGAFTAQFDTSTVEVRVLDRRLGEPDEVAASARDALGTDVAALLGSDASIEVVPTEDPRQAATVVIRAGEDAASQALEKLGGVQAPGQSPWDITADELKRLRDSDAEFVLLDVREESETSIATLDGTLIPLGQLDGRLGELDRGAHIVVHCRSGFRGAQAVRQRRDAGFEDAWHLNGGLMAWRDRVDPSIPQY